MDFSDTEDEKASLLREKNVRAAAPKKPSGLTGFGSEDNIASGGLTRFSNSKVALQSGVVSDMDFVSAAEYRSHSDSDSDIAIYPATCTPRSHPTPSANINVNAGSVMSPRSAKTDVEFARDQKLSRRRRRQERFERRRKKYFATKKKDTVSPEGSSPRRPNLTGVKAVDAEFASDLKSLELSSKPPQKKDEPHVSSTSEKDSDVESDCASKKSTKRPRGPRGFSSMLKKPFKAKSRESKPLLPKVFGGGSPIPVDEFELKESQGSREKSGPSSKSLKDIRKRELSSQIQKYVCVFSVLKQMTKIKETYPQGSRVTQTEKFIFVLNVLGVVLGEETQHEMFATQIGK